MEINILKHGFRMEDAYQRLTSKAKTKKNYSIEHMDVLFYPYLLITYELDMGKMLKNLNETVYCMADLHRKTYSMANSKGTQMTIDVDEKLVIPATADHEELIKTAPTQIYGEILTKKRVMTFKKLEYVESEVVYKPFYVIECLNHNDEYFHVLFDAVSGDFTILDA